MNISGAERNRMNHDFQNANMFGFSALKKPPIKERLPHFRIPEVREHTLPNGLHILVIERHTLPKVSFRLGINLGSKYDPAEKKGLSELLSASLKKGTSRRDYQTISDTIESVGGELDSDVNEDGFFVFGEFFTDYLDLGLELLSEISLSPVFPDQEVEKERSKLIANLANENSSPQFLARRRMIELLFQPHPYGCYKTEQSLHNISRLDLQDFHRRYFVPHNSFLVFAGDIKLEEAVRKTEKYFGEWKGGPVDRPEFKLPGVADQPVVNVVDRPGSEQVNLLLGNRLFARNHPDYHRMLVMNKILGGGGSGRLFLYLREEKGYTYGAYSSLNALKETGAWLANAEVRPEVTIDALKAFFEKFQEIKTEPVSSAELKNAKRYLVGSFPLKNETPASIASLLLQQKLYGLPKDYWQKYAHLGDEVSSAEVRQVAEKYVREQQLAVVVVGDAKRLAGQLEKFGQVEVYDVQNRPVR